MKPQGVVSHFQRFGDQLSTSKNRVRKNEQSSKKFSLADGRTVAVAEYGTREGTPVFFCHGWPSSRTMAELTDAAARELNLRIISPDRPGIRDSSLHPERKLLDWPPLLAELADQMGIGEFRILGISGGAPYAFAAAWAMPERVRAIAVVSGAPPLADLVDRGGLLPLYRWLLFFYPRHRGFCASVSRRASFSFLESSDPLSPASAQTPPTLRCQRDARHRRLRGLLRKSAPGLARLGRWSDGRRRNLRAAMGFSARGNRGAGSPLARKKGSELSLATGSFVRRAPPARRRASGRRGGTLFAPDSAHGRDPGRFEIRLTFPIFAVRRYQSS